MAGRPIPVPVLGHPLIDRQHRRLQADSRVLHEAVVHGRPALALLTRLLRDTRRHFATEERLMDRHGYPERAGHRALHQSVEEGMQKLRRQLLTGMPMHRKHTAMITDWLGHHVSEADRNLVMFLVR